MRWLIGTDGISGPEYCKACKQGRNASTECNGCLRPELLPDVEPYAKLYSYSDTQWRTSGCMGLPVGLDYPAVKLVAKTLDIEWDDYTLDMVRAMEQETLSIHRQRASKKNGAP